MKPWQAGAAITLLWCAMTGSTTIQSPEQAPEGPTWLTDIESARATARRTGKPLFVAFR